MSSPETRTRGCSTCRFRKKKCDGTLPHCTRCTKSGKTCPGYSLEPTIKIRDMTEISERKVKSRTAGRDQSDKLVLLTRDVLPNTHLANFDASLKAQLDAIQRLRISLQGEVTQPMSTDWQQIAIPRFFSDYGSKTDLFDYGNFSFLSEMYGQRMATAHFDEALQAVAFMSLANQLGKSDLSVEARKLYGSAITRVATKLQDVQEATDDTIIVSSFLFSFFEMLHIKAVPKGFWNIAHDFGRISLLRARGTQMFSSPPALKIFSLVLVHSLIKCISCHIPPPEELLIWFANSISQEVDRVCPTAQMIKHSWEIGNFCAAAQDLFDSTERDDNWALSLLQLVKAGIAIENQCEEWADLTPRESVEWSYKTCRPRSLEVKISQKYPPHFYYDTYTAWTWNFFRACRIRLHEVLLHCITCIQSHPCAESLDPETGKESKAVISEMVFDVCCSTYFCLGHIDSKGEPRTERSIPQWGYQAFWPFWIAMVSAEEGSESKAWLRENLEYITNTMGIELAAMLARRLIENRWDIR